MAELPAAAALLEPPPAPQPQELVGSGSAGNLAAAAAGCGGSYEGLGEAPAYAPGTQKVAVEGQVLRWHHENGKEVVPALAYIEQLERELAELRQQMEAAAAVAAAQARAATALQPLPGNELLDYLKRLSPEELVALTDCASEDVLEAMNVFVQRLMGERLCALS